MVPGEPVYVRASVPVELQAITIDLFNDPVRYIIDWGDGSVETTEEEYLQNRPDTVYHRWLDTGTYAVRARAFAPDGGADPDTSDWSGPCSIDILSNGVYWVELG